MSQFSKKCMNTCSIQMIMWWLNVVGSIYLGGNKCSCVWLLNCFFCQETFNNTPNIFHQAFCWIVWNELLIDISIYCRHFEVQPCRIVQASVLWSYLVTFFVCQVHWEKIRGWKWAFKPLRYVSSKISLIHSCMH